MPKKLSNALTSLAVKNAKPGRHADGGGLYLLVKDSGARSWVFRFMLRGKARDLGLGTATGPDAISLQDARIEAGRLRAEVKAGTDPLLERDKKAGEALAQIQAAYVASTTFKTVAERYIADNRDSWRNAKHRQQWENTLSSYVYPVIGDLPINDVGTAHVLEILEPIWKTKPETASRIRGRIETVLDAAKARELRTGENPARWRGHIAQILKKRQRLTRGHHTALPYADVPAFVEQLRNRKAMAALALEFTILTAARTGEVTGATWVEFDLTKKVWTVPATRMKAGKEHRIPLSPRTLEILEAVKPMGKQFVFPGERGGKLSGMAMAMLLRRMGTEVTVHGFRSAFRDWTAEATAYAHEVCEMALAHTIGNKAEAAYRRGDLFEKRTRLMSDWATFVENSERSSATVTPIRQKAD
jgi:integrase